MLLGPNGAGKSTCINMLSGDLPPSEGRIHYLGKDITALTAAQRSQVGIGRSYQRTNIFPQVTVLENVQPGRAVGRRQQPWSRSTKAMEQKWALDKARACIEEAGLGQRVTGCRACSATASSASSRSPWCSPPTRRCCCSTSLAGMGSEESASMVEVLKRLRQTRGILLVEHDMDAVFAVADMITVMVNGQLLECGPPAQVKASVGPSSRPTWVRRGQLHV